MPSRVEAGQLDPEFNYIQQPILGHALNPEQLVACNQRVDYLRRMADEPVPFLMPQQIDRVYAQIDAKIGPSPYPEGMAIPQSLVKQYNLLHLPGVGSVVAPPTGNETDPRLLRRALVGGESYFEFPPPGSGLKPDIRSAFVRFNRFKDPEIFERLVETVKKQGIAKDADAREYILHDMAPDTLWLAVALLDAVDRLEKRVGFKITDESGKLLPQFASRTMVINGDNGGGNTYINHLEHLGVARPSTVVQFLSQTQTAFLANLIGTTRAKTVNGACAASGSAFETAETYAMRLSNPVDIVFTVTSYPGPIRESQEVFGKAGVGTTTEPPLMYTESDGYAESQAGVVSVAVSTRFMKKHEIPLNQGVLIRTLEDQGRSLLGSSRLGVGDVPEITIFRLKELLQQYYKGGYKGTAVWLNHGANTMGSINEVEALLAFKAANMPEAQIVATSTPSQIGHEYAPRSALSLELSEAGGLLWGMASAEIDLSLFPEQEVRQVIRRQALTCVSGKPVEVITLKQRRNGDVRTHTLHDKLGEAGIEVAYASVRVPQTTLRFSTHTGLGGDSVLVAAFPIEY